MVVAALADRAVLQGAQAEPAHQDLRRHHPAEDREALFTYFRDSTLAAHYRRNSREAAAALTRAIAIRDLLISIFTGISNGRSLSSQHLSELNSALAQAPGILCVQKNSDRIETEWTSAADGLRQILFPVLASAAELLASPRVERISECGSNDCTWLFVDDSRNRSRRWCDMRACGNRMKARRHYQRAKGIQ